MVEAFEQPGYPLLAVQWHPERAYRDPAALTHMDGLFRWLAEEAMK
jgi:gamma-glutamyl-gamma-aminobutyrate hydrolase PuuD